MKRKELIEAWHEFKEMPFVDTAITTVYISPIHAMLTVHFDEAIDDVTFDHLREKAKKHGLNKSAICDGFFRFGDYAPLEDPLTPDEYNNEEMWEPNTPRLIGSSYTGTKEPEDQLYRLAIQTAREQFEKGRKYVSVYFDKRDKPEAEWLILSGEDDVMDADKPLLKINQPTYKKLKENGYLTDNTYVGYHRKAIYDFIFDKVMGTENNTNIKQ